MIPLVLLAAASSTASGTSSRASACGKTTVYGKSAFVFCGTANARVLINNETVYFLHGSCSKSPLSVTIGTYVPSSPGNERLSFFSLRRTPRGYVISIDYRDLSYTLFSPRVRLTGATAGTFSGSATGTGTGLLTGRFACS